MKTTSKRLFLIPIITSLIYLTLSSCSCTNNLEKKCVLKQPEYQDFVKTHGLEDDINTFLNEN